MNFPVIENTLERLLLKSHMLLLAAGGLNGKNGRTGEAFYWLAGELSSDIEEALDLIQRHDPLRERETLPEPKRH